MIIELTTKLRKWCPETIPDRFLAYENPSTHDFVQFFWQIVGRQNRVPKSWRPYGRSAGQLRGRVTLAPCGIPMPQLLFAIAAHCSCSENGTHFQRMAQRIHNERQDATGGENTLPTCTAGQVVSWYSPTLSWLIKTIMIISFFFQWFSTFCSWFQITSSHWFLLASLPQTIKKQNFHFCCPIH